MIGVVLKKLVMDAKRVTDAADRAADRALARFGAFVMTRARQSIKQAPKALITHAGRRKLAIAIRRAPEELVAPEGSPPYAHKGKALKRFIRFAVDKRAKSVIIGPQRLPGKIGDAPHALEEGGPSQAIRGARRILRGTRVRPHPFMGPAFVVELPKAAGMFIDAIK